MGNVATIEQDDTRLFIQSDQCEPISIETHEVRYLDLCGEGVPDAVEHVTRRAYRSGGSDTVDTVQETRRLEYGIGVDGKASGVVERTTVSMIDGAERTPISREEPALRAAR